MMSGGFQTESQQMTHAMASLRDVLPRLEEQLRTMTTDVDRQMRERSEEQQRLQGELVRQVEAVVSANERSRAGLEELIERIGRYAVESTEQLQGRLAESGEAAVNSLITTSADGLRELRLQLGQVNEVATVNVEAFGREVGAAAEHVASVRKSLEDGLVSLRAMAVELNGGLAGARDGLAAAERAGGLFSAAGESITDATRLTEATVSSLGDRLQQEAGVIEAHRALAGQVEKQVLPALERVFGGYTEALEEQSRLLQAAWQLLAEKVKQTVDACGAGLQDSVEQLAEQVGVLQKQLDRAQGRPGR
jgi:DNA anti-recombination protein RmuC